MISTAKISRCYLATSSNGFANYYNGLPMFSYHWCTNAFIPMIYQCFHTNDIPMLWDHCYGTDMWHMVVSSVIQQNVMEVVWCKETLISVRKKGLNVYLNWPSSASFIVYFRSSQESITSFKIIKVKKCSPSIRRRDSNPQPLGRESPPITTSWSVRFTRKNCYSVPLNGIAYCGDIEWSFMPLLFLNKFWAADV